MAENRQLANVKSAKNDEFYFKFRNVLYGSGWAGWGFESNVAAQAANSASAETLRDFPIFEHDPEEMFSATITTNMQNSILAKGIPALSSATGVKRLNHVLDVHREIDMNVNSSRRDDMSWCRNSTLYGKRWLHSDIQNTSFFFTHKIFRIFTDNIMEDAE